METFIQPKITGYRQLNETEAALMNEVKLHAEQTRHLLSRIEHYILEQPEGGDDVPHSTVTHPARWLAEGRTDLQKGFMCVVRAIAQPTSF